MLKFNAIVFYRNLVTSHELELNIFLLVSTRYSDEKFWSSFFIRTSQHQWSTISICESFLLYCLQLLLCLLQFEAIHIRFDVIVGVSSRTKMALLERSHT